MCLNHGCFHVNHLRILWSWWSLKHHLLPIALINLWMARWPITWLNGFYLDEAEFLGIDSGHLEEMLLETFEYYQPSFWRSWWLNGSTTQNMGHVKFWCFLYFVIEELIDQMINLPVKSDALQVNQHGFNDVVIKLNCNRYVSHFKNKYLNILYSFNTKNKGIQPHWCAITIINIINPKQW